MAVTDSTNHVNVDANGVATSGSSSTPQTQISLGGKVIASMLYEIAGALALSANQVGQSLGRTEVPLILRGGCVEADANRHWSRCCELMPE